MQVKEVALSLVCNRKGTGTEVRFDTEADAGTGGNSATSQVIQQLHSS